MSDIYAQSCIHQKTLILAAATLKTVVFATESMQDFYMKIDVNLC